MGDWIGFWLVRGLSGLFCLMPSRLALAIGALLGRLIFWVKPSRKVIGYRNLKTAFGGERSPKELHAILKKTAAHLGRMFIEILRFPRFNQAKAQRHIVARGLEHCEAAIKEGRGVMFVTAHLGNWELVSVAGALLGYPTTVLAREQTKTPRLDRLLNQYRERTGCRVVGKGVPLRALIKALKAKELVGVLADQGGGHSGAVMVPLFGRLAPMPTGAFEMAQATGARLLPTFIRRIEGPRHEIKLLAPLELTRPDGTIELDWVARRYLEELEHQVRRAPDQWLWLHNRWKRSPQHRVLILSDGKVGHLNQALVVAEELKSIVEAKPQGKLAIEVVEVRFKSRFKQWLMFACGWLASTIWQGNPWALRKCLVKESYRRLVFTWCNWVISCGSSVAPVNLWVGKEHGARSVVIMRPKAQPLGRFDLAICPAHDGIPRGAKTVVTTGALHRLTSTELEQAAERLRLKVHLANRLSVSLLLGGGEDRWLTPSALNRLLEELLIVTEAWEAQILLTTSRRTPAWAEAMVEERLRSSDRAPLVIIANRNNLEGAVPGMLGVSQAVVVTGESITMISEACASARPVIVIGGLGKPKHQRFVQALAAEGYIRVARVEEVGDLLNQCWEHASELRVLDDRAVVREALGRLT